MIVSPQPFLCVICMNLEENIAAIEEGENPLLCGEKLVAAFVHFGLLCVFLR